MKVDRNLSEVSAKDYDAIVLPGGQINPDVLRTNASALELVLDFHNQKKVVDYARNAPWCGRDQDHRGPEVTSYKGLITSRNPGDLDAFSGKIIEEVNEGRHLQRNAA